MGKQKKGLYISETAINKAETLCKKKYIKGISMLFEWLIDEKYKELVDKESVSQEQHTVI